MNFATLQAALEPLGFLYQYRQVDGAVLIRRVETPEERQILLALCEHTNRPHEGVGEVMVYLPSSDCDTITVVANSTHDSLVSARMFNCNLKGKTPGTEWSEFLKLEDLVRIVKQARSRARDDMSRPNTQTFTAVQWAALESVLTAGLKARVAEDPSAAGQDERVRIVAEEVLPVLKRFVDILPQIEPLGCGLDHPDRAHWLQKE